MYLISKLSLFGLGRLSRLEYARNQSISVVLASVWFFLALLGALIVGEERWTNLVAYNSFVSTIVLLLILTEIAVGFAIGICAAIQRFHDVGRSGWWTLLIYVPLIGIVAAAYLLIAKGSEGENKYGIAPIGVRYRVITIIAFVLTEAFLLLLGLASANLQ